MIPSYRDAFNAGFSPGKYKAFRRELASRCGMEVPFQVSETPCFFPAALVSRLEEDGKELIRQLVDNPEYRARSEKTIPPQFRVPYIDVFGLDSNLRYHLSGLNSESYTQLLRDAIVAGHDPANVVLMEVHPEEQKTLPDFLLTEKLLGVRTVCITKIKKEGRRLFFEAGGKRIPIHRIYNRTIVDELERKGVSLPFDFRDDLDVEWAGHPNWYFRISKYSIPYLKHPSVPRTWFLDQMPSMPSDLENFVLKPLYSFAGLGVVIAPSRADIDAIPSEKRGEYILQERLNFMPVIETPHGPTKAELRMMYVWIKELTPVLIIVRMGRGLMMGVDHNKNMQWVGSSAGLVGA